MKKEIKLEDFDVLIKWPKTTSGYVFEKQVIESLFSLCKDFGVGVVVLIGETFEKKWRNGEILEFAEKNKEKKEFSRIIETIILLSEKNGYGRVPQLIREMGEIFKNGEKAKKAFLKAKKKHFESLRGYWGEIFNPDNI